MILAIMTRGRVNKQETIKHIPKKWLPKTYLICPKSEEYLHRYPKIVAPDNVTNYSQKFQWLLNGGIFPSEEKIVIMDDDLWFNRFEGDKLITIKDPEENESLFDLMEKMLDEVALVGVHPRMMAQNWKGYRGTHEWNSKIVTVQGINRKIIKEKIGYPPSVERFPILADVFLNCHLLSRGIPNARIVTHFVDWGPSQAAGGCDYRTSEMQKQACEWVASMYGPYARTTVKTPKTAKWLGESRTDLVVRWKELYQAGLRGEFNEK